MKSAYELAMDRLQKQAPSVQLTEKQKSEIAEIDAVAKAKVAEREVFLKDQIRKADAGGKFDEVEQLQDELARDLRRIQSDCEAKKEKVRQST
jgi:hypothetical protein